MAIEAEALRAPEETKASAWRPMKDAPTGVPIVAKHKPNDATPHGWVATIIRDFDDPDEDRRGGLDTILHYNGDTLRYGFHGCWDGWMTCEEASSLIHRSALVEDTARAAEDMRERAAKAADGWLKLFGDREPKHVSAQTWAGDAVRDIAEAIRALPLTKEAADANR